MVGCISRYIYVLLTTEIRLVDVQFKPKVLGESSRTLGRALNPERDGSSLWLETCDPSWNTEKDQEWRFSSPAVVIFINDQTKVITLP